MWREILASLLMSVDVLILFSLVPYKKQMWTLAAWVASLHMLFPLLGYYAGVFVQTYLEHASPYLSGFLLSLLGVQMLVSKSATVKPLMPPYLLAIVVSLDSFSVSISFGMLKINQLLFISCSGILSFLSVIIAQKFIYNNMVMNRAVITKLAGLVLLLMGLATLQQI